MLKFFKESKEELSKVVWPGRDEVFSSTIVVLIAVIVISLFLFFTDWTFEKIFNLLVGLGS
ncbi:MAG: preprotein translocase subunit SecE [Spirochaetia bacterium]|nr:preprotein translocase subunit SecE [Spirochaetia bacterium]